MKKSMFLLIFLGSTCSLFCQSNNKLIVKNVTVLPLHVHQVWEAKDVIIENGSITMIREHIPGDTTSYDLGTVNGTGKYLLPSYADAHAHLPEKENLAPYFLMNLANGVTTLRSMRGQPWHLDIDDEAEFTPRLILGTPPISRRDTLDAAEYRNLFKSYQKDGFDFVKILSVRDKTTFDDLVGFAKTFDLPLSGHCPSNVGLLNVNKSEVYQSIEHLGGLFRLPDYPTVLSAVNQTINEAIYHCPTLDWYYTGQVPEDQLRKRPGVKYLPAEQVKQWEDKIGTYNKTNSIGKISEERADSKKKFTTRLKYLNMLYRQGGLLLLSPDASGIYGIPGFGIHTEMQHYSDAKIDNYDILKATCYNLAAMLSDTQNWGTIKEGSQSDMILLNKNPMTSIKNTNDISGIIFKGKYYSQKDLLEQLDKLMK